MRCVYVMSLYMCVVCVYVSLKDNQLKIHVLALDISSDFAASEKQSTSSETA